MKVSKRLISILLIVVLATTIFIIPVTSASAKTNKLQTVTKCEQIECSPISATMKWNKVKGAQKYIVYLYCKEKLQRKLETKNNKKCIKNLKPKYSSNYDIKIQAVNNKTKSKLSKKFPIFIINLFGI